MLPKLNTRLRIAFAIDIANVSRTLNLAAIRSTRNYLPAVIVAGLLTTNFCLAEEKWDETNPKHPRYKHPEVLEMIDHANYCDVDEDCGNAGPVGPYGCYIPVNIHEAEALNQKLEPYRTVIYSCRTQQLECANHKCRIAVKESKQ